MEDNETKQTGLKGAVLKRTWFNQARELLTSAYARCEFYEALMCVAFDEGEPEIHDEKALVMFSMCRPYVEEDKQRYRDRCARNRANATAKSTYLRVATTGSDSQPVAPNSNTKSNSNTNNNTNTNTNTNTNLSTFDEVRERRERFELIGLFFLKGAMDPAAELDFFWSYYESLGWKNSRGAAIVSKYAAAKMWQLKGDPAAEVKQRRVWWESFKTSSETDERIWTAWCGMHWQSIDGQNVLTIRLSGGEDLPKWLDDHCAPQLRTLIRTTQAAGIQYRVV